MNYYEECPDDSRCACGVELPEVCAPDSWAFQGYCCRACAFADSGALQLMGPPAIEAAEAPGAVGGPGFERDLVRDWLRAARNDAPAFLLRQRPRDVCAPQELNRYPADSWMWRLRAGGEVQAMRLTKRKEAEAPLKFERFTKRTDDPKLAYIERMLDERGIAYRRNGHSWHAPILEVDAAKLDEAWGLLDLDVPGRGRFDDIPDDDVMFMEKSK